MNAEARFQEISPCPFPAAQEVPNSRLVCGYIRVPENRDNPASAELKLPVAIIKTTAAQPKSDPVVFLTGGPGASAISSPHYFALFASHPFGQERDIILFTQRGGFMSEPALICPALEQARRRIYLADHSLDERDAEIARRAQHCLRSLQNAGRDLRGYSAIQNAHDLRDLRRALDIDQWNLLAVSYGTYIAQEAARLEDNAIRSMVLDSPVSMESDLFMSEATRNFTLGLTRLVNACRAQPACHAVFPSLATDLKKLISKLKASPLILCLKGTNGPLEMVVNWHDFLNLVHWMLYNARTLPLVPLLVHDTLQGDYELITLLMNTVFPAPAQHDQSAAGTFFAVVCKDQYTHRNPLPLPPSASDLQNSLENFAITSFMTAVCSAPNLPYGKRPAPVPVSRNIPTLLLSGYYDPMTPDIYATQIARHMPNSSIVRIRNYGHSTLSGYTACQTELATAFLNDLLPKEHFPCLKTVPEVRFALNKSQAYAALE
ncbi:alpha/beta fold hydrolase [Luteithermobacter gelatinilyticus]|uniref:alpha/beta fold hydrolase n=1 Tax=Luteithermobacter gelatinilyticus TaxID=2582913 RepID=UPI00143D3F0B|nr:alpha/beta hydrolase [Luteithermobacter gelatinilyticus]